MTVEAHRRSITVLAAVLLTATVTLVPTRAEGADLGPFATPQEFVAQQYRDFLGREADPGGLNHWSNMIRNGVMTPAAVIERFMATPEFTQRVAPLVRLYFAYFLRIPDFPGLIYWSGEVRAGRSLGSISQAFATAPEFVARYGFLSDQAFVDQVYLNVLGRPADRGGRQHWTRQLDLGLMTRGDVMVGFSESQEYRRAMRAEVDVTMVYVGMLRRTPDRPGFNFWVTAVESGRSIQDLISDFLRSTEYAGRFPTPPPPPPPPAPSPPFSLPYRVNAGGPKVAAIDGGVDWQADAQNAPNPYVNFSAGNASNRTQAVTIPTRHASVPASTPSAVFQSERWDPVAVPEMRWDFPVEFGKLVEVRLYFASGFAGASQPGDRVFDVKIDGGLVLDDYDPVADVGHQVGVMKRFTVTTDGDGLDIEFLHLNPGVENPQINGIEILPLGNEVTVSPVWTPSNNGVLLLRTLEAVQAQDPSAGRRFTVRVGSGTFRLPDSTPLELLPFVDIEGTQRSDTVIDAEWRDASATTVAVVGADNASLRRLTVKSANSGCCGTTAIVNDGVSPTLADLRIEAGSRGGTGIQNRNSAPRLENLSIRASGLVARGVVNDNASPTITGLAVDVHGDQNSSGLANSNGSTVSLAGGTISVRGFLTTGVSNSDSSLTLTESLVQSFGSSGAAGIINHSSVGGPQTVDVRGTTVRASTASITTVDPYQTTVSDSTLIGGPVTGPNTTCINVTDEDGNLYGPSCETPLPPGAVEHEGSSTG